MTFVRQQTTRLHCVVFETIQLYNETANVIIICRIGGASMQEIHDPNEIQNAITCNLLDQYYFDELRANSLLLKRYDALLIALTPGFGTLLSDLFYLLYKIEPVLNAKITPGRSVVSALMDTYTLKKLRGRTAANTTESYLALKILLDELLVRLRGTEIPVHLEALSDALESLKEARSALEQKSSDEGSAPQTSVSEKDAAHLESLKKKLGFTQDTALGDVARGLSEALRSLAAKETSQTQTPEPVRSESDQPLKPQVSNQPAPDLEAALKSALAPEVSEFLERLDAQLQSDHKVSTDHGGEAEQASEKSGEYLSLDQAAEPLAEELQSLAMNLDAGHGPAPPDALAPAGIKTSAMENGEVDQWRIQDGAGLGAPVSASNLGYDGRTQQGGNSGSLKQTLQRLGDHIARLEGQIADVLRPIDFQMAMNKSIEAVDQFTENLKALGVNADLEVADDFDHVLELYKALREPSAIRFLNKVGKKREIARRAQYRKRRKMTYLIDRVGTGDRLDGIIDEEIMSLSMDVFGNDFYDRLLNQTLLVYEMEGRVARDRGPIVLCYDGSGSMEGIKIEETKALLVAFIEVARIQKRRLITLQFASKTEPLYVQEFNPHHVTIEEIMRLLNHFIRGGTDFETPLKAAVERLKDDHYRHADVLMITDGFSDIREGFKKEFTKWKAEMAFKLYAIIIHGETYGDYGDLGDISDEILEIRDRDLSNWNEKISAQLFERI
jgi:uncharacterized protein with von Willebrand factor type A (vWA) domain